MGGERVDKQRFFMWHSFVMSDICSVFLRRPFFLVFIGLIIFIRVWYHFMGGEQPVSGDGSSAEQQSAVCMGTVEEIQVRASGRVLVLADTHIKNTSSETIIPSKKVLIYDTSKQDLFANSKPGNKIRITGTYAPFSRAGNPGEFDEYMYYSAKGMDGKIFAESVTVTDSRYDFFRYALFSMRQKVVEQFFSVMEEDDAGILCAMIAGEKAYLPEEEKELYQQTGIGHMLVISGLHISLLAAGLFFFLRSYVMPMKGAVAVTVVFLFLYGELTGFQVAAVRAVLMMCGSLLARYAGRSYDALSVLSFSGIITLLQEPVQLFQCGFLLSYTAVGGILLFSPVLEKCKGKNGIWQSMVFSASVFAVTMPVMLWFYYEICPYSVLANVVVLPFLSLLVGVGAAGCAISFFSPAGGEFVLGAAHYILKFYEIICRFISGLPASRIVTGRPSAWCIVVYYLVLVAVVCFYRKWEERWCFYAGVAVVLLVCYSFRPGIRFLYTQLDVGQGDCACIFNGDTTVLIDGGSSSKEEIGKYVIQKFLKFYGRTRIDKVFISHSDADHTNGITELVENQENWGISVSGVVMPDIQKRDENYETLVRTFARCHTKVSVMKKGNCFRTGELSFLCLHPYAEYEWKSENDYSLTLEITWQDVRILSTGDLEEQGEGVISGLTGSYDLLKVGHHGSKTSTSPEFLHRVSPQHAVISAGRNNRYGHPAAVTLEKLRQEEVCIWNTAEQGAVFLWREAGGKRIESYRALV